MRRLERPGNIRWEITVRPYGDGEVTVLLPVTEDCEDQGAICTGDGRRLSNRTELTVTASAPANSAATGAPTISGASQVGETLTADTSGIADGDGLDNVSFTYQWVADDTDIAGAAGSSYTLTNSDEGKAVKVMVSFTDDAGNEETLTSEATDAVEARPNSPATGGPTISGTAQVGQTLTADTSGIADDDGLDNVSFSYQWLADDTEIQRAIDSSYTLVTADAGKAVKVRVSFTDDAGNEETLTSAPTEPVTVLVWSATLTAGSSGTYSGYSLSDSTGALSTDAFSLGAIDHSVKLVTEDDEGMLSFVLDHALLTTFTLHVGALRFSSEDASPTEGDHGYIHRWDKGTVDWSAGDEVELALTLSNRPLMAIFADTPSSHDSQEAFTFELRFSEEFDLSYVTLRDHAFTVTGGEVTGARRLDPPGNIRWEISVSSDGDGNVTIVLPVTVDCNDQGAICAQDGRRLLAEVTLTVAGPGE